MIELYPHQRTGMQFLVNNGKGILAHCMRSGKSRTALMAAHADDRLGILCPPVAVEVWKREIAKWRPDFKGELHIISDSKVADVKDFPQVDFLIVDEAHRFKNADVKKVREKIPGTNRSVKKIVRTQRVQGMVKWLRQTPRAAILSGTIMPNRHKEMWIWARELLGMKNKKEFEANYCGGWNSPWGWDATKSTNKEAFGELFRPIMMTVTAEELKDTLAAILPPTLVYMNLPVDEREKEFDLDFVIKNAASIAIESLSDVMKMSGLRKVPQALEHIKDVLEQEEKVVVWCHHQEVAEALREGLSKYDAVLVNGATRDKDRWFNIDKFQQVSTCRVMVANILSMGVAITLDAAAMNIVVEAPWVPGDLYQAMARCGGPKQKKAVRTDILAIAGSIDGHVLEAILKKTETIDSLNKETTMTKAQKDQIEMPVTADVPLAHTSLDLTISTLIVSRAKEFKVDTGVYIKSLFPVLWEKGPEVEIIEKSLAEVVEDNKKKVKRAGKAATKAEQEEAKNPPPPPEDTISLDKVRNTLALVIRASNPEAARDLLNTFGAKRVSDLSEDKYADFLAACEAKLNSRDNPTSLLG